MKLQALKSKSNTVMHLYLINIIILDKLFTVALRPETNSTVELFKGNLRNQTFRVREE